MRYTVGKNPTARFPTVGVYCDDVPLNSDFYTYTGIDTGNFFSFQSPLNAYMEEVEPKKTAKLDQPKVTKVGVETSVSIVNGRAGGSFYAINHQASLEQLVTLWNDWLNKLRPYTDNLTLVAADGGLLAAPMVTVTALISSDEQLRLDGKVKEKKPVKKIFTRMKPKTRVGAPVYMDRFLLAVSSEEPLLSHVWGLLQSLWIAPQYLLKITSNIDEVMTYEKMKTIVKESNGFVLSDEGTNITLSDRHNTYASAMVHARNGKPNAVMEVIKELEKQGRAGFLSSIIGKGLGYIIPGAEKVISSIGDFLP